MMYASLKDKVAIVTGAGRAAGLGAAIALRLGREGGRVIVHDAPVESSRYAKAAREIESVAEQVRALGGKAATYEANMLVESDVEALIAHAVETYGRLDILINNAGVGSLFGPLVQMTQEDWDTTLNVNLRGCFFAIKHAARQMTSQSRLSDSWGSGRIVSIASRTAKSAAALLSAYAASKHGLIGLTRAAAVELAPQKITVNAVCPNHVTTELGAWQNDFMAAARGQSPDQYMADMVKRIPLGRVGFVSDTANAVAFLCSEEAAYITAESMNVSGGEEYH